MGIKSIAIVGNLHWCGDINSTSSIEHREHEPTIYVLIRGGDTRALEDEKMIGTLGHKRDTMTFGGSRRL